MSRHFVSSAFLKGGLERQTRLQTLTIAVMPFGKSHKYRILQLSYLRSAAAR